MRLGRERTWDAANGKWHGILPALGLPAVCVNGRNQPCPINGCGGKDRFRFINTDGNGTYICSQCGGGTGLTLLMKFKGWDFREAAMQVDKIVGNVEVRRERKIDTSYGRKMKNQLWADSYPVQAGDPVDLYLTARGLTARPTCLRTVHSLPYRGDPPSRHPAMLAMFTGPDGKPNTLHRTWLTEDGRKAEVEQPRKMMPGVIARGGAIRLAEYGSILGIAEGIETALSAAEIHKIPCWSAVSEGILRTWNPPSGLQKIVIFGDADKNYTGQSAAYDLARRLSLEKCAVEIEVRIPQGTPPIDWNDVWQGRHSGLE